MLCFFKLILATFVVTVLNMLVQAERRYSGYKVYTVQKTSNVNQYNALQHLSKRNSSEIEFWSDLSSKRTTDIMVAPQHSLEIEEYLKGYGLSYTVTIYDVQKLVKDQQRRTKQEQGTMNWKNYHRLGTIYKWMDEVSAQYPQLVHVINIGKSTEGRDLKLIKISKYPERNNPAIFIDGAIHAREWIAPAVVTYIANKLISLPQEDRDLLENVDWHILPVINTDGYEFTFTEDRLWRKSRSINDDRDCPGVDLNRNFGFHWGEVGAKDNPCRSTYHGKFAFSEPETNHTANYILNNRNHLRAYLSFHSYAQLWLTPYAYTDELPADYESLESLGLRAVKALHEVHGTEYEVGNPSNVLYLYSGSSQDWAREYGKIKYSYTIELRDQNEEKFLLSPELIIPSGEETWAAVKVVARQLIEEHKKPVAFLSGDDFPNTPSTLTLKVEDEDNSS